MILVSPVKLSDFALFLHANGGGSKIMPIYNANSS